MTDIDKELDEILIKLYWHGHFEGVVDGQHINGIPKMKDKHFTAEKAKQQLKEIVIPEWHEIEVSNKDTYPPVGLQVLARMTHDNQNYQPIYIVVKHVDEDDCSWRTSDGDELSYWVNITHWQHIKELEAQLSQGGES